MQRRYDAKNPAAFARLKQQDIEVRPFDASILRAAREASEQLLADEAASDPAYRRILDGWRRFRDASFQWFGTAELAYARAVFGDA